MSFLRRILPGRKVQADSAPTESTVLAYYMHPDGSFSSIAQQGDQIVAGKSSSALRSRYAYTQFATTPINSSAEGYAYASIVSVWAHRCIEIRRKALGRLDWYVQDRRSGDRVDNHPLTLALERAKDNLVRKHEWAQLVWGETFFLPRANEYGNNTAIHWLNNLAVDVDEFGGRIRRFYYYPRDGSRMFQFAPHEIAYFKTDNPFDDNRGLSRFETVLLEVGIDKDIARTTKAFYANDARPGVLLIPESDMSKSEREEFIEQWKANFQGPRNAGRPVLAPRNLKEVREVNRPPSIDDVELRESVRREICAAFGVPLSIAGAWDDANYQSAPEQRKSLYEETIIPQAEDIARDWTRDLLPFFDDSGRTELAFDPTTIMALIEDQQERANIATTKLMSGGITLNEYREETGTEPIPGGDVIYVPQGVTPVPVADIGTFQRPQSQQPPALPQGFGQRRRQAPRKARPSRKRPPAPIQDTPQDDATDELSAWEKKALNKGSEKAREFQVYHVPRRVEQYVRSRLEADMDKGAIRHMFQSAARQLKKKTVKQDDDLSATPEEYLHYWGRFDELREEIGDTWLMDYMTRALDQLEPMLDANLTDDDIGSALAQFRDDLVNSWVGTIDSPGIMTRLTLAGMAAGNEALERERSTDYRRPVKQDLTADWELLSEEALAYVRQYTDGLIQELDITTQNKVRDVIARWIESGDPLVVLRQQIRGLLADEQRARAIAETEATRVYNEGSFRRWEQMGVTEAYWMTVRDNRVCPICQPLHRSIGSLRRGWYSSKQGTYIKPPAHTRCRCFSKPKV